MRALSSSLNSSFRMERAASGERPFFSGSMTLLQMATSVWVVVTVCIVFLLNSSEDFTTPGASMPLPREMLGCANQVRIGIPSIKEASEPDGSGSLAVGSSHQRIRDATYFFAT